MKIGHCASFAPNACGLYEAARDMAIADMQAGHEVYFFDVGLYGEKHIPGAPDKIDNRGGITLKTDNPDHIWNCDIIIAHTGIPDNWYAPCQAPIIWILHGRPKACFSPEYTGKGHSYSLIANLARWPRVKYMVSFWPSHKPYWDVIIPKEKLVIFDAPPIDEKRFCPEGPMHNNRAMSGKYNIMVSESWREDIDIFEITQGLIEASKIVKDVKFHFYGMELPLRCFDYLFNELRRLGTCGEIWARRTDMEQVYRAADILISPQSIATRSIAEALSCGVPVIADIGCEFATWQTRINDPIVVAKAVKEAIEDIEKDKNGINQKVKKSAKAFSLENYNLNMEKLYNSL